MAPPEGHPRFPSADGLRGLAALAIVATHTAPSGFGRIAAGLHLELRTAVQVFFALSGFLLFRPFLAADALGLPRLGTREFFRRRLLRIVPAYWTALTVTGLVLGADVFTHRWWIYYGFVQIYSLSHTFQGIPVAWSLSVEVSFYLVLPLIAWAASRLGRRFGWRAGALILVCILYAVGVAIRALDVYPVRPAWLAVAIERVAYGLPGQASFFAVGMFLAILSVDGAQRGAPRSRGKLPRAGLSWALAGLAFLLLSLVFSLPPPGVAPLIASLSFRARFLGNDLLVSAMVFLILLPAVFDAHRGIPQRVLRWRPLCYCGVVSYGIFLWHLPIWIWLVRHGVGSWAARQTHSLGLQFVLMTTIAVTCGLIAGALSYRLIELPFLRHKARRRPQPAPVPAPAD